MQYENSISQGSGAMVEVIVFEK